jgi:hypothetical protein
MSTRPMLVAIALALSSSAAWAQTPIAPQQLPRPTTPLPTPSGAAGEGLYVAGADRTALNTADTPIANLTLPRGTYQVIARAVIANDRDADGAANCRLRIGSTELDYVSITLPPMSRREFMLLGVASTPGPLGARIDLMCQSTPGIAASARWARIHALTVSRVTGSAPAGN